MRYRPLSAVNTYRNALSGFPGISAHLARATQMRVASNRDDAERGIAYRPPVVTRISDCGVVLGSSFTNTRSSLPSS